MCRHASPGTWARRLLEAELLEADVVLGPTLDGGYYLIGSNQPEPTLFSGIPRNTAHVLQVTLDACKQLHFRTVTLQPLRDLDTVSDLVALGFGRP